MSVRLGSASAEERAFFRRILEGLGKVLSGKAVAGLLGLGCMVLATRLLGPHDYGVLMLLHGTVSAVAALVEFPTWQALIRYGETHRAEGERARLLRLIHFATRLELGAGLVAVLATATVLALAGPRLGFPPEVQPVAFLYALAMLGAIRSAPAGYLQLVDRFDLIAWHNLVMPGVRLAGCLVCWALGLGLFAFMTVWVVAALAEFASLWLIGFVQARRALGKPIRRAPPGSVRADNPGIWRFLFYSNADLTLRQLAVRLAPLVVGATLGPAAAGLLAVAQRATVLLDPVARILGDTSFSTWARMAAAPDGGAQVRRTLAKLLLLIVALCVPIVTLVGLFADELIALLAGPAFAAAAPLMVVMVVARAIAFLGAPLSSALSAMGRPNWSLTAGLTANLVALSALPFLLARFGLAGAAWQAMLLAITGSGLLALLILVATRPARAA